MTQIITDEKIINDLLDRRIEQAIPGKEELKRLLLSGKKLKIYQGFDPSSANLHIGHIVGILVLKILHDLGHEVIFLIGDFTATIGDPTGKDKARIPLTIEKTRENAKTYQEQVKSILSFEGENPVSMRFNSEWLAGMNMTEVLQFAMNFTAQQILERDMYQKRLKEGKPISLHEFLYPVLVTKDAISLDVDIEMGGTDQIFNMSVGRHLIKALTGKDKLTMAVPLLTDTNGKKFGKSEGNAINIVEKAENLFGQIMSLTDEAIMPCFRLITLIPTEKLPTEEEIKNNPMEQKKKLAWELVKMLHDENTANLAQEHFEKTVQADETPENMPEYKIEQGSKKNLIDFLAETNLTISKSEAKRLVEQNAVKIDGQIMTNPKQEIELKAGMILKVGKRKWLKLV
ncbi:tyrosine--tRNA ligase [Candidatus Beckwithbacteria bacterium]|nr:tyrosine--tRNA ligase [Candidatus Beckwithbacteria bacterium]